MGTNLAVVRQGPGRPRKLGPREPSGRLKRVPTAQVELEAMIVVLSQPHRLGSRDQRRRWAVGRLILDGKIKHSTLGPDELERAAELYSIAHSDMRWVMGSKRPFAALSPRRTRTLEPEEEAIRAEEIIAKWSMINQTLNDAGKRVKKAAELLVLDNPEHEGTLPPWIVLSMPVALEALCKFFGLESKR